MFEFYVNMQKRGDGIVYADLHKTDHKVYFTAEEAQAAIDADPGLKPYRHVVKMVAILETELVERAYIRLPPEDDML